MIRYSKLCEPYVDGLGTNRVLGAVGTSCTSLIRFSFYDILHTTSSDFGASISFAVLLLCLTNNFVHSHTR